MKEDNLNKKSVSEPSREYETTKRTQGIGKDFNLQERFENDYNSEEFLAEMKKRISK